jgi:hypothetical protein
MLRHLSKRLAGFITDHITWEFLVFLLARPWTSGLAFFLAAGATVTGWAHKQPLYVTLPVEVILLLAGGVLLISLSLQRERISEIRFDYLPERSPEQERPAMLVASLYGRHVPETRQPNAHGVSADSVSCSKLFDY